METRVVNYKGYVIMSEQGEKRGIFFRKSAKGKVKYDFIRINI